MSKQTTNLTAEPRQLTGRKVKQLRAQGKIPANIFGKKVTSTAITLSHADFVKAFNQAGETNIINLTVTGESSPRPVLISNIHQHPITDGYLHIDLRQVDLKEKVTASVPLEVVGESPAVKEKGGVLVVTVNEIEVEALPTDLPDKFTIDISSLSDIGNSLHISDLKVDKSKLTLQLEDEETIALIQEQKEEEEEATPTPAEAEVGEGGGEADESAQAEDNQSQAGDADSDKKTDESKSEDK